MTELRETTDKVIEIIKLITQRDDISETSTRENTPEWDSLKHIDVIFALEDEFEVEFDNEEMSKLHSVKLIAQKIATDNAP